MTCTGIRHIPAEFETAKLPDLADFRHDLDPSGASSPSSPSSGSFSYKSEPDGVIDIFAQQADKEKREFLAAVAHREAQDEEEQKAFMIRERSNAEEVAQQVTKIRDYIICIFHFLAKISGNGDRTRTPRTTSTAR